MKKGRTVSPPSMNTDTPSKCQRNNSRHHHPPPWGQGTLSAEANRPTDPTEPHPKPSPPYRTIISCLMSHSSELCQGQGRGLTDSYVR